MVKLGKRLGCILLTVLLVVTFAGCGTPPDPAQEQKNFDEFLEMALQEQLQSSSYSTFHQLVENPEHYGIDIDEIPVRIIDTETDVETIWKKAQESAKEMRDMLWVGFERSVLTEQQQDIFDSLQYRLELAEVSNQDKFMYMENFWEVDIGIYAQIPQVFSHIRILNEQDLQKTLELMGTLPETFDWILDYTREQEKRGYMRIYFEDVLEFCETQANGGLENSTYLQLRETIANLGLSAEQTQKYQTQLTEQFQSDYLGAYKNVIEGLKALQTEGENHTGSLSDLKNGREYYEKVLLPDSTGNGRTVGETIDLLDYWIDKSIRDMMGVMMQSPELLETFTDIQTKYSSYTEIIEALQKASEQDFPKIAPISYEAKELPEDQRQDTNLAYYLMNALDATTPDQIRVNPTSEMNTGTTYTVLAHESVPGHMYQYNYMKENCPDWTAMQFLSWSGYAEGYGRYAELVSLDYLTDVPQEERDLFRVSNIMSNALSARLDIGIHYEGWDLQDAKQYFREMGLNEALTSVFYDYQVKLPPARICSYGVGLVEFLDLREYAESEMGDAFIKLGFHEAILKSGSAPFPVVSDNVTSYILRETMGEDF